MAIKKKKKKKIRTVVRLHNNKKCLSSVTGDLNVQLWSFDYGVREFVIFLSVNDNYNGLGTLQIRLSDTREEVNLLRELSDSFRALADWKEENDE